MANMEIEYIEVFEEESVSFATRWKSEIDVGFTRYGVYLVRSYNDSFANLIYLR